MFGEEPCRAFHSARDLAFAIESVSGSAISSGQTASVGTVTANFDNSGSTGISRWFANAKLAWIVGAFLSFALVGTLLLLYFNRSGSVMAATLKTDGNEFEFSAPKALFKARLLTWAANFHEFDVTPDGQRFLIGTRIGEPTATPPSVILNWTALLEK